jgi:hypothetical protein
MEPLTRQVEQILSHGLKELELDNFPKMKGEAEFVDSIQKNE